MRSVHEESLLMRLHFENNLWSRVLLARVLLLFSNHLETLLGFGLIILRGSYKETFRRDPHNVNNLTKVAECSEVAPFK